MVTDPKKETTTTTSHPKRPKTLKQRVIDSSINLEEEDTTGTHCTLQSNEQEILALLDVGASRSITSDALVKRLGYQIDAPSNVVFTIGNGEDYGSLGMVYDVLIHLGSLIIPINLEVLPSPSYDLVIGNNWFKKSKATVTTAQRGWMGDNFLCRTRHQ
ncbi:hypothetical protein A0J61_10404 [Choanephora cucurbitarum]|uniref:Peptidase A2 domain-containing protein n=1 Tax=Choanephora cucurbitarum TaxID=101091 RepID=A0A1C7MYR6_9FUNG|nr:hypothetical protein A0J61_10404 [Choanephora cucurbitarum]